MIHVRLLLGMTKNMIMEHINSYQYGKDKKTLGVEVKGEVVQIDMVMDSLTSTFSLTLAWVI